MCPPRYGSSPLARGLRLHDVREGRHGGIIPARAGFTPAPLPAGCSPRDHPRSRGVYMTVERPLRVSRGSSPLARGLQASWAASSQPWRIIPARAGFTSRLPCWSLHPPDHPRSRGVYWAGVISQGSSGGSSPLARGLLGPHVDLRADPRIIPARAGFTAGLGKGLPGHWDHPRSRGVYVLLGQNDYTALGSSPLARGLR